MTLVPRKRSSPEHPVGEEHGAYPQGCMTNFMASSTGATGTDDSPTLAFEADLVY